MLASPVTSPVGAPIFGPTINPIAAAIKAIWSRDFQTNITTGSGVDPTHTRATTQTIIDHESIVRTCLSGETGFTGGRRVENILNHSEDLTDTWSLTNGSGNATVSSTELHLEADGGDRLTQTFTCVDNNSYILTLKLKGTAGTSINLGIYNGVGFNVNTTITFTSSYQIFSVAITSTNTGTGQFQIRGNSATPTTVQIEWVMAEESTGQTVTDIPSEYVSKGVLSSPYHGANVDGVAWKSTDNGNSVASNVVTEASGTALTGLDGILLEEARTNQCFQSEDLSTTWTANRSSVNADAIASPDGATTADKVLEDSTASSTHYIYSNSYSRSATAEVWTGTIYAKKADYNDFLFRVANAAGSKYGEAVFNLTDGSISAEGVVTWSSINTSSESLGNGWYKCRLSVTTDAVADGLRVQMYLQNASYSGDGTSGTYFFGGQLELGTFPTSYIKTTTTTTTRNKSELPFSSSGIPVNNLTGGMNWTPEGAGQGTIFLLGTYVDASNYTAILHDGTNIIVRKRISGVNTDATKALTYVAGTTYEIEWRFDSVNGIDIFVDNVKGTNHVNTADIQVGATYEIGADGNGANHQNGNIKDLKIYPKALTDSQVAA